jgi:type IV pilus assembly protein PilA
MKKMNNKGFSLVELIVVVLIMAIIAVALAPQVMKWVENSRKSNDIENYNALVEAANIAGTDEAVVAALKDNTATVTFASTAQSNGGYTYISSTALEAAMLKTLPTATATKVESSWAGSTHSSPFKFTVAVTPDGIKVTKVNAPEKDFS